MDHDNREPSTCLDKSRIDYALVDWARCKVVQQANSLQRTFSHLLPQKISRNSISVSIDHKKVDSVASFAYYDGNSRVEEEEENSELIILRRLRQTMDRAFLQKLSSCAILIDRSMDNWRSSLFAACCNSEYEELARSLDNELSAHSFDLSKTMNDSDIFMPSTEGEKQEDIEYEFEISEIVQNRDEETTQMHKLSSAHFREEKVSMPKSIHVACVDGQWISSDTEALASICSQLCIGSSTVNHGSRIDSSNNLVLENLADNLRQRRIDGVPAVIVLKNFQLFAMEAGAQATVATSSVGGRSGKGEGDGGSCAKKKQLLIYTLLDLMHKSDFFFILLGVTCAVDVQQLLEKRVVSRLNAQFIHIPGLPSEQQVLAYLAQSCLLPLPPRDLRVGQHWKEFRQSFNRKIKELFRGVGFEESEDGKIREKGRKRKRTNGEAEEGRGDSPRKRSLIQRAVAAYLSWGCNIEFFRRVLISASVSLSPKNRFLDQQHLFQAFRSMEPPCLRETLSDLSHLELLVFACAARLGLAAKRDHELAGPFSFKDLLIELPKLGSWAAGPGTIDFDSYSFAAASLSSENKRPLSQFYVDNAVRSLIAMGLLSASEGQVGSARGFRPQSLGARLSTGGADFEPIASTADAIRFASGKDQTGDPGALWPSSLLQGPFTVLHLRHSPEQIRQAFSIRDSGRVDRSGMNNLDPISGLESAAPLSLSNPPPPPLKMTERLRKAVLSPLDPLATTIHSQLTGATREEDCAHGVDLRAPDSFSTIERNLFPSTSIHTSSKSKLMVNAALEDLAL